MLAIVLSWHQRVSWKLGRDHGSEGRPYCRPWWINEAFYALGYAYAKYIEHPTADEVASPRLIDLSEKLKRAL
jgi:hypothetical protein